MASVFLPLAHVGFQASFRQLLLPPTDSCVEQCVHTNTHTHTQMHRCTYTHIHTCTHGYPLVTECAVYSRLQIIPTTHTHAHTPLLPSPPPHARSRNAVHGLVAHGPHGPHCTCGHETHEDPADRIQAAIDALGTRSYVAPEAAPASAAAASGSTAVAAGQGKGRRTAHPGASPAAAAPTVAASVGGASAGAGDVSAASTSDRKSCCPGDCVRVVFISWRGAARRLGAGRDPVAHHGGGRHSGNQVVALRVTSTPFPPLSHPWFVQPPAPSALRTSLEATPCVPCPAVMSSMWVRVGLCSQESRVTSLLKARRSLALAAPTLTMCPALDARTWAGAGCLRKMGDTCVRVCICVQRHSAFVCLAPQRASTSGWC